MTPSALPPVSTLHFGAWPDAGGVRLTRQPRPDRGAEQGTTGVLLWDRDDPILRDVGLDALRVGEGAAFSVAPDARGVRELARGADGPLILAIDQLGTRRVATAFALRDSNWPVQSSFPIFLANVIESLTLRGEDQAGRSFLAGEPVTIPVRSAGARVIVRKAGPDETDLSATVAPGERAAVIGRVERVGIYRVEGDAASTAVAVNMLDATESAIASPSEIAVDGAPIVGVSRGQTPREIWPWLLIAAAALSTVEWLVFSAKARA